ncbi:hypothetical protein Tco_0373322 [Tanacetum coccineum]
MFLGDVSIFLFLVFDEVLRLLLVAYSSSLSSSDADSDGDVTGLTTSLPLLLVLAYDLDDVISATRANGLHSWLASQHGFHWLHFDIV